MRNEFLEAIRVLGFWKTLYLRFLYRHHMRLIHRFGKHWHKTVRPGGDIIKWCQWCGDRIVVYRHDTRHDDMVDAVAYMMEGLKRQGNQSKVGSE